MTAGGGTPPAVAQPRAADGQRRFRAAMRRMPTSVVVVAGMQADEPVGMVVGTFTAVSLDPLLVGFLGDRRSGTFGRLLQIDRWCFSVLTQADAAIVDRFRRQNAERFKGVDWRLTRHGTPLINGSTLAVHTRQYESLPAGDHDLALAQVLDVDFELTPPRPLVYLGGRFSRLDPYDLAPADAWQLGWE